MPKHYTSILIGAGQSAPPLAAALTSAHGAHSTLIIERAYIGGTCINFGCTPTKTMIASGRVAYLTDRGSDYGINSASGGGGGASNDINVEMTKIRQRKRDIVTSFREGSVKRLEKAGVDVVYGTARFTGDKQVAVRINAGGEETYTADQVFINTGCRPADPGVPGLDGVDGSRILDSTSIMELDVVPKRLVVVGAGYVGLEFGQLFRRLGSEVMVISRGEQVLNREDKDVAEEMLKILNEDGIKVELGMTTVKIEPSGGEDDLKVKLVYKPKNGGDNKTITASRVLFAAGRVPNTDMLDLSTAGVEVDSKGFIKSDELLKTSKENVYVMGDVKGGPAFTHISYDDFRIIKNNLLNPASPKLSVTDRMIPYTVYTDPQLGHIGLHEAEARSLSPSRNIKVAKMPMSYVARALETDETRGLMKAIVDGDSGEILGFTCLGIEGGEIMSMMQIAMMGGVKWEMLRDATFAHPTLAESLNNLWGFLE